MFLPRFKAIWAAHGTQIMGVVTFIISGADLLLIEILEVVSPGARPWVRLTIMALAYSIAARARNHSREAAGSPTA